MWRFITIAWTYTVRHECKCLWIFAWIVAPNVHPLHSLLLILLYLLNYTSGLECVKYIGSDQDIEPFFQECRIVWKLWAISLRFLIIFNFLIYEIETSFFLPSSSELNFTTVRFSFFVTWPGLCLTCAATKIHHLRRMLSYRWSRYALAIL